MTTRAHSLKTALALAAAAGLAASSAVRADDLIWDNGATDMVWNTSSVNWGGGVWSNSPGSGARFTGSGVGAITLSGPITARSLDYLASGYSLVGVGPLSFTSSGTSTLGAGVINVSIGNSTTINTPVSSSIGLQKIGDGNLVLGGSSSFSGGIPLAGYVAADVVIGTLVGGAGGTLTIQNASALPPSARVALTNGILDLGSNNVTLGSLTFRNPFANAVTGTGTLRVTGEIHVLGDFDTTAGNIIYPNVDLGGGTQIVRVGVNTFFALQNACQFRGTLSNGSLFKSYGLQNTGVQGNSDGMALYGNNTYTGSTTINGGAVATGTNATTSVTVSGGGVGSGFVLQSTSGSLGSATSINVIGGSTLRLDNNAALTVPLFPAAQNNDRIRNDAAITLRDSSLTLVGLAATPASETFGSLNIPGGHNIITLTPTTPASGGTAILTCAGDLSLGSRATLAVNSPAAAPLGGAMSAFFVNGSLPAADATGLLPRMIGNNTADFLTYSPINGLKPYTGYTSNSLTTTGVNVALTAATPTAGSMTINALKSAGSFSTTLTGSDVLTVSSGMVYSTTGTNTFAGTGALNFGANTGVFWGTNIVSATASLTGSQGLIVGTGTLTLAGNMSGLSGMITVNSGTLNVTTNTLTTAVEVRTGSISLGTSQTSLGTILLGVPEQDALLFGTVPNLTLSAAGTGATFNANIIVANGTQSYAGNPLAFSFMASLSPLSNTTGSQTLSGNIMLNSPWNIQGGGGGGTGATNFTGVISGPSYLNLRNGRVIFGAASVLSNAGGLVMGAGGNTGQVQMLGTATSNGPITINGGNSTSLTYAGASSVYTGTITVQNSAGQVPSLIPLSTSTLNNTMALNGDVIANVATGLTASWAGPISGSGPLNKNTGTGTLVLSNPSSTYSGLMTVNAGTLLVHSTLPGAAATVATGATLGGNGTIGGAVTVNAGGTLAPGASTGTLNTGNLNVLGTLACELKLGAPAAADLVNTTGTVTLGGASVLNVSFTKSPAHASGTFIVVLNDGSDAINGTFSAITGIPASFGATINYAFTGTDSLGRVGTGNDIAIVVTPSCYANCDGVGGLTGNDFQCFLNSYVTGDTYADCDHVGGLTANDFQCFLNAYVAGCS